MKIITIVEILAIAVSLNCCNSCEENHPPEVLDIQVTPSVINTFSGVTFTALATDPDDDYLNYKWTCSSGIIGGIQGKSVEYLSPLTPGLVTITVKVSDAEFEIPFSKSFQVVESGGTLNVNSTPNGANIIIDGVDTKQVTPMTFNNLSAGEHTVTVFKEGYSTTEETIVVDIQWMPPSSANFTLVPLISQSNAYLAFPGTHGELQTFIAYGDTIVVEKINGQYVFQGDMILTENQVNSGILKGAGLQERITKWSNNTVYYSINSSVPNPSRILDAINNYQEKTVLKFEIRTNQPNYVEFIENTNPDVGGYSQVGMVGGRQVIALSSGSPAGVVVHEMGHTVGLIHEHSRSDRDRFIKVYYDNINPDYKFAFSKINTAYKTISLDFSSIMMYSPWAFTINGSRTITTLDGSTYTWQRNELSSGDIEILNLMYSESGCGDIIFNPTLTYGSVQDIDNNTYKTIQIGSQTWMAENLKTTRFRDGSDIQPASNATEWTNLDSPGYCWYLYDANYFCTYGALYNWAAVNTGNLCPTGWHVPTENDWLILTNSLGGDEIAGYYLKETGTTHWFSPNDATNGSGFTALPGGICEPDGGFYYIQDSGYWWTANESNLNTAAYASLFYNGGYFEGSYFLQTCGLSVRCIKNN